MFRKVVIIFLIYCVVTESTGLQAQTFPPAAVKKPYVGLRYSGSMGFEAYHTTFQNPRVLSQPTYFRISTQQTLSIAGLPFGMQGYFSTEPQSLYSSNFLRIYLDKDALKSNLEKRRTEAMGMARNQVAHTQAKINEEKARLSELENKARQAGNEFDDKTAAYENKQKEWQQRYNLTGLRDSVKVPALPSANADYWKQRANDSLALKYLSLDTEQLHRYLQKANNDIHIYKDKLSVLDSTYKADTAKLGKLKRGYDQLRGTNTEIIESRGRNKVEKTMSGFTQLQIGAAQVVIHPYSLNGTALRGLNAGYQFGRVEVEIAAGAVQSVGIMQFDRNRIPFNRGAGAIKLTTRLGGLKTDFFGHLIKDSRRAATINNMAAYNNSVFGIHTQGEIRKGTAIEISSAAAGFSVENGRVQQVIYSATPVVKRAAMSNKAYRIFLEQQLGKGFSGELLTQAAGSAFRNLGNPFMRSRFEEHSIKIKGKIFAEQLQFSGFYKRFHDNPGKLENMTNVSQGYGISLQSRFKKKTLPNLNFSISPYEQGNNHPDTLLRVNSRFNLMTGGLSWRFQRRKFRYSIFSMGTSSVMALTDTMVVAMRNLSIQQDVNMGEGFSMGLTTTFTRTNPGVDSTQSNTWQIRTTWSGKGIQIMAQGHYAQFLNGAYRRGFSLTFGKAMGRKFRISAKTGFDEYYRLWGLKHQTAFNGMLRAEIRW